MRRERNSKKTGQSEKEIIRKFLSWVKPLVNEQDYLGIFCEKWQKIPTTTSTLQSTCKKSIWENWCSELMASQCCYNACTLVFFPWVFTLSVNTDKQRCLRKSTSINIDFFSLARKKKVVAWINCMNAMC